MTLAAERLTVVKDGATLLGDVSFSVAPGEYVALLGPNGAGKSTLLRTLAGIERTSEGACLMDGAVVATLAVTERARKIAYLPQLRETHWNIDAERLVALGRFAYGAPDRVAEEDRAAVERAMAAADVVHLRSKPVQALSGGEQARVHLARALAAEAPVLLADEPVSALDPRHQVAIMKILRRLADEGRIVVAALHDLDLALHFATRVILLDRGRIAADRPPAAALSADTVRTVFGIENVDRRWRLAGA
jgi:iron complex transport system ATP-binding protein